LNCLSGDLPTKKPTSLGWLFCFQINDLKALVLERRWESNVSLQALNGNDINNNNF